MTIERGERRYLKFSALPTLQYCCCWLYICIVSVRSNKTNKKNLNQIRLAGWSIYPDITIKYGIPGIKDKNLPNIVSLNLKERQLVYTETTETMRSLQTGLTELNPNNKSSTHPRRAENDYAHEFRWRPIIQISLANPIIFKVLFFASCLNYCPKVNR